MSDTCSICLEEEIQNKGERWTTTTCGHRFHWSCLKKLPRDQQRCPNCRHEPLEYTWPGPKMVSLANRPPLSLRELQGVHAALRLQAEIEWADGVPVDRQTGHVLTTEASFFTERRGYGPPNHFREMLAHFQATGDSHVRVHTVTHNLARIADGMAGIHFTS